MSPTHDRAGASPDSADTGDVPRNPAPPPPRRPGSVWAGAENAVLAAMVCGMAAMVLIQIVSRLVFGQPLSWSTEVATDLLIWSAFLGFAVGVRERGHVALTIIEDRLSGRALYAVRVLQLAVFAFLLGALTYGGASMALDEVGTVSSAGIPRWIPFSAVPVGSGLSLLHVAVQALQLGHGEPERNGAVPAVAQDVGQVLDPVEGGR